MKRFHFLALALTALALSAPPALGQAPGLFTGDDDDFFRGNRTYVDPPVCIELTDSRIRQRVADQGFGSIYLNVRDDLRIQVRATRGEWVYLLQVSTCTGEVIYGERLRPA